MQASFSSYIRQNNLFTKKNKLLLAFSGGIDSVACFHLLKESGYQFSLAHCNFQLRGNEADEDEIFTKEIAEKYGIEVLTIRFDTQDVAKRNRWSIQMAARNLRYDWFEKIRQEQGFDYILLAHHADDSIETMLINLVRGTGIRGLTGIQPINGPIRRPLLFAHREEIDAYVKDHNLTWREDSSNAKEDYMRNRIRHTIIPELIKLNPAFRENGVQTMNYLKEDLEVLQTKFQEDQQNMVIQENHQTIIRLDVLKTRRHPHWILYNLLTPFGFHSSQIDSIMRLMTAGVGKQFYSEDYQLTIDRDHLYIHSIQSSDQKQYLIQVDDNHIQEPINLSLQKLDARNYSIINSQHIGAFDFEKLSFPLKLDHWQDGDRFMPLGMDNYQKVSDFLVNEKVPRHKKKQLWVLRSGSEIIWIIGYRIDHRFRITENTRKVLQISFSA